MVRASQLLQFLPGPQLDRALAGWHPPLVKGSVGGGLGSLAHSWETEGPPASAC